MSTSERPLAARPHYALVVLSLVMLAAFGALGLARFGYTSLLPAMQEELRLTHAQMGALQSWNLAGYLATVVIGGVLAARFGPRVVIAIALGVTSAAMVLTGLSSSCLALGCGRFLAGAGGACANVPAMALLSAWFGVRRRGLAAGAGVAGSSLGLMLTGLLIPPLLSHTGPEGWRWGWYGMAALALGVAVLCALFLRNRPEELGLTPLGSSAEEHARPRAVAWSWRSDWPRVCRSRQLWHLAAIYFAFGFSYIIYTTFFIRYLVSEGGFTQRAAGLLWFKIGLVSGGSGFLWGWISDRWGRRLALLGVFLLQGSAFLLLGLSLQPAMVYLSTGLFAVTAWSVPALMAALAGDLFGARLAPVALALMTIVFGVGQAMGPYCAGRIAEVSHSFSPAFVLAGVIALLAGGGGTARLRDAPPSA